MHDIVSPTLISQSLASPFWEQAVVAAIGPIVAAILGGLVVGLIIQYAQNRREFLTFRTALSVNMMQVAYGFYTRLIEVIRQQHYGQEVKRTNCRGSSRIFESMPVWSKPSYMLISPTRKPGTSGMGSLICLVYVTIG